MAEPPISMLWKYVDVSYDPTTCCSRLVNGVFIYLSQRDHCIKCHFAVLMRCSLGIPTTVNHLVLSKVMSVAHFAYTADLHTSRESSSTTLGDQVGFVRYTPRIN